MDRPISIPIILGGLKTFDQKSGHHVKMDGHLHHRLLFIAYES